MHKAKRIFKRVFFCFVSVVLVCCMLFNMATPKAQAVAIVDDLAIGITALLLLAAAGIVFTPKDSDGIAAIGNSFTNVLYSRADDEGVTSEVVDMWIEGITVDLGGDPPEDRRLIIPQMFLNTMCWWLLEMAMDDYQVETEGEAAPDGYAYYGDYLLPIIPNCSNPYVFILRALSDGWFYVYYLNTPVIVKNVGGYDRFTVSETTSFTRYMIAPDGTSWQGPAENSYAANGLIDQLMYAEIIYSNHDVMRGSDVYFSACPPPAVSQVSTVEPSAFLGDLPDQIQSGEKDAEDIIFPGVIDYGSLIQDGMTLEESVIDTMTQLSDGSLSYENYLGMTLAAEQPVFTQNLPITDDMAYTYAVGEEADTFTVEATGNSDGSGTLTYEWLDTSTVPYTVLGSGQSYTPDTSQVADYSLACRVTNTVPCSFVETGYVTNVAYSWTYHITVSDTVVDPPGSDTETDDDEKLGIISGTLDRIESLLNPDTDTLTDSSQALQGSMNELGAFEQSQLDGLQNNKHVITDAFKIFGEGSTLLSAFNLVTYIVNGTYNSLGMYQVVITLPVVLGIFLFICSRVRGFDRPRKNNPGSRSSQAKVSAAAGGNDPKSPEV